MRKALFFTSIMILLSFILVIVIYASPSMPENGFPLELTERKWMAFDINSGDLFNPFHISSTVFYSLLRFQGSIY